MGWFQRIFGPTVARSIDSGSFDDGWWGECLNNAKTVSGINVNQQTALNSTGVLACVSMLAEDFAKLTPSIYRIDPKTRGRESATDHALYALLWQPNDYQNYFEFAEMMQSNLVMRGNCHAVIVRDQRGAPTKLLPVNADWVALWESADGGIFYRVTPSGLHMMAELQGEPFMIPAEDILHVRGLSLTGLLGVSKINLGKEAIGLALAQEQQSARWMLGKASLSGLLTTNSKLTPDAAQRMAADWKATQSGLQNAGKIAVLEQGLKYQALNMSADALQFIQSRSFQLQEVARLFRIPMHMVGDLTRSTNSNISQQAQEYINFTISGYTSRWKWKLETTFGLRELGLHVDYDLSQLTRADKTTRYNNYARGISGGFLKPNEARLDDGLDPDPAGDELQAPSNLASTGSQASGTGADGGGRPTDGPQDITPKKVAIQCRR